MYGEIRNPPDTSGQALLRLRHRPVSCGTGAPPLPSSSPRSRSSDTPIGLARLNEDQPGVAEAVLLSCCGSRQWARRLAGHRPYPDLDALLAAADEAAYDLTPGDLAEALAAEATAAGPPPLSDVPLPPAANTALRAALAAYEARFGHVFVLSPEGAEPEELLDVVLASIHARLGHDPDKERIVSADQLRRVARTRLTRMAAGGRPAPSPHS